MRGPPSKTIIDAHRTILPSMENSTLTDVYANHSRKAEISDRDFVGDCRKLAEFDFPFVAQRNDSDLGSASLSQG